MQPFQIVFFYLNMNLKFLHVFPWLIPQFICPFAYCRIPWLLSTFSTYGPWWITAPSSTPGRRKFEELRSDLGQGRDGTQRATGIPTLFRSKASLSRACNWPLRRLGSLAPLESDWGHCLPPLSPGEVPLWSLPPIPFSCSFSWKQSCVSSRWWQGWYLQ